MRRHEALVGQQAADLFVEVREDGGGAATANAEVVAEGALGQACEGGVVQVLAVRIWARRLCQGLAYVEGATRRCGRSCSGRAQAAA